MQGVHSRVHAGKATYGCLDLRDTRHEDQDVPLVPDQRTTYGRCDMVVERRGDPPVVGAAHPRRQWAPDRLDRVQGTRDADHRSAPKIVGTMGIGTSAEQSGRPFGLDGGRHRHQGQVLTQVGPDVDEHR